MDILQRAGRPLQNCNDWQDKFLMKKRTQKSAPLEDANSHHGRLTIFFSRYDRSGFRSRIYQALCVVLGSRRRSVWGKILEEMNKRGFSLSPGTLYPALHALLHEGDVTVRRRMAGGKIRKCYRLTAKGRRELAEIKARLRTLVRVVFR